MSKRSLLRLLTAVASFAGALAGLDLTGVIHLFPADVAGYVLSLNVAILGLKEVAVVAGDYIDDGKRNDSFLGR